MIRCLLIALVLVAIGAQAHASSNGILTQGLSSVTSSPGGSTSLSALTSATATNTINNTIFPQEWDWPGIGSATAMLLTSSGTGTTLGLVSTGGQALTVVGNASLSGTTTLATVQIGAGNALFTTVTATNIEGIGNANLAGTTTVANLSVTGTCAGCSSLSTPVSIANGGTGLANTVTGDFGAMTGALGSLTTGQNNTAIGLNAGNKIATDSGNTAIGSGALQNMAIGNTTTLGANTAGGFQALSADTTGFQNTAWGYQALTGNTTGLRNTGVGYKAGSGNTTSSDCVALGFNSGCSTQSIAIGSGASTGATADISIGYNETVNSNESIAIGGNNTSTGGSVVVGYSATGGSASGTVELGFTAINEGTNGIAIGDATGRSAVTGANNILIGANVASTTLSTGVSNILIGISSSTDTALNTTSTSITIGGKAGSFDTSIGFGALAATATNGNGSAAFGYQALAGVTTGVGNTAYGYQAGDAVTAITVGSDNTFIGYQAQAGAATTTNSTALGYQAATTASNQIVLGNSSISSINAEVQTISALSDRRHKKDIEVLDPSLGLNFIMKLKPVSYDKKNGDETLRLGFIAQDIYHVLPDKYRALVDERNPIHAFELLEIETIRKARCGLAMARSMRHW